MGSGKNEKVVKRMNQSMLEPNFSEKKILDMGSKIATLESQPCGYVIGGFVLGSEGSTNPKAHGICPTKHE